jgi:hypothetical protein
METAVDTTSQDNVLSKRIRAGKRTYFIDVKATKSGKDFYIVITESRRVENERYAKQKVFLYKEEFQKFSEALIETITHIERELLPPAEKVAEQVENPAGPGV